MPRAIPTMIGLIVSLWASFVGAAPCAGFTDVDDTNPGQAPFCANVEWLKNRAITLGCTSPTLYCPADPVSRLAMAAFMNRLGTALIPSVQFNEETLGSIGLATPSRICMTSTIPAATFPRTAVVDAQGDLNLSPSPTAVFFEPQYSFDGVIWQPLNTVPTLAHGVNGVTNVSTITGPLAVATGATVQFAIQVSRGFGQPTDVLTGHCHLRVQVQSATVP